MKKLLMLFLPIFFLGQQNDDLTDPMKIAMKDIHNKDFKSAIINLDKSLKIYPKNPSALYFKGCK